MKLDLNEIELNCIVKGIKCGILLPEYDEDEYVDIVVPLLKKLENVSDKKV